MQPTASVCPDSLYRLGKEEGYMTMAKKRLSADIENFVSDLELLVELSRQMLSAVSLTDRIELGLETLTIQLGYPRALVAVFEPSRERLIIKGDRGFSNDDLKIGDAISLALDRDLLMEAVTEGVASYFSEISKSDLKKHELFRRLGITEYLAIVPLIEQSTVKANQDKVKEPLFATRWSVVETKRSAPERWHYNRTNFSANSVIGLLIVDTGGLDQHCLKRLTRFGDLFSTGLATALESDNLNQLVVQLKREKSWEESILKSVADPIVLTNLNNSILLQNRRAAELLSINEGDPVEKRRAIELNLKLFQNYLSNRNSGRIESIASDIPFTDPISGAQLHYEVISTPSIDMRDDVVGIVTVFRDVTDLRRAGQKLEMNFHKLQQAEAQARRERDQLDLILENVGVPIIVCDNNLNFILINQRAEPLFQLKSYPVGGSQDTVATNRTLFTELISKFIAESETVFKTEIELLDPQNSARIAHDLIAVKIFDESEKISAIVSILHDLTKLRELERRRVEQQLFKSEKMAAIGLMAAQIAHEVNNPLEVIKNSLYLLETTSSVTRSEPQTVRFLEIARKETERVSGIIKQMLGFSRPSNETEPVLVKINEVIDEVMVLVEKTLKQGRIKTETKLGNHLPAVLASADQLKQVFLNLIINSQHAMEGGGQLTITTSLQNDMSEEGLINPSVIIEFLDSGIGIEERDLINIFEPFYSLNKGKKGTGLGLWVSLGIVRSYGGRIKVKSTVGKGSSFSVILPIAGSEAARKR